MIPQDVIEQVRQATDIAQIVGEYVRLKQRGKNFKGICPFHVEKTPSFNVNTDKQIFHCFGCGKGGNVFTFLMEHEKMSFVDAVKHLARKANIVIKESGSDQNRERFERLNYAHTVAVDYFHKLLFDKRYDVVLTDYLMNKRGISHDTIEEFQLGFAGEAWDGLLNEAARKDIKGEEMARAGLAGKSEKTGNYFDRFRYRLMIPIYNLSGKPIAFGGRTMKKGEPAKYVNSPETPLYSKSNVLYGLNFSRDHIRDSKQVYVVEGYFDVISLWQVGIKNVVASSGTAFTEQQARLLARFAEEVYLFFDADSAGQQAALRSVDALFDAGLEVKVIQAPEGEDPDSLAREHGVAMIENLRDHALGFIPYRLQDASPHTSGIMGREKLVKELSALAAKISDPTRRALFIQEAAASLDVNQALIREAGRGLVPAETKAPSLTNSLVRWERDFISLLLNNPPSIRYALENIAPDDFDSRRISRLYSAIIQQHSMDGEVHAGRLMENFDDEEAVSLLSEVATIEWDEETLEEETIRHTRDILQRKEKRIRKRYLDALKAAEAEGDQDRADEIVQEMKQHGLYDA